MMKIRRSRNYIATFILFGFLSNRLVVVPVIAPPIATYYTTQMLANLNSDIAITQYSLDYDIRNKFEINLTLDLSLENLENASSSILFVYSNSIDDDVSWIGYLDYEFNLTTDNENITHQTQSVSSLSEIPDVLSWRTNLFPNYQPWSDEDPDIFNSSRIRVKLINITLSPLDTTNFTITNFASFIGSGEYLYFNHFFDKQKLGSDETQIDAELTIWKHPLYIGWEPTVAQNLTPSNGPIILTWSFLESPSSIKVDLNYIGLVSPTWPSSSATTQSSSPYTLPPNGPIYSPTEIMIIAAVPVTIILIGVMFLKRRL
ncbi:MAG: hypothetical protein RTU92_11940 [Candidatus Thorarchaeota archaeon]